MVTMPKVLFISLIWICLTGNSVWAGYKFSIDEESNIEIGLWGQMWAVTDVEPDVISNLFITPFSDLQTAMDKALEEKGEDASVLFLMDGGLIPLGVATVKQAQLGVRVAAADIGVHARKPDLHNTVVLDGGTVFVPQQRLESLALLVESLSPKDAARIAAELTGQKKNALYDRIIELKRGS